MNHAYSDTAKHLKINGFPDKFQESSYDISKFDQDIKLLERSLVKSYESNDEDIEDLSDIISIINLSTNNIIMNVSFKGSHITRTFNLRIVGKKTIKKKYSEFKYNDRRFFNHEEAHIQFTEFLSSIWKPSVRGIINLCRLYRPNIQISPKGYAVYFLKTV